MDREVDEHPHDVLADVRPAARAGAGHLEVFALDAQAERDRGGGRVERARVGEGIPGVPHQGGSEPPPLEPGQLGVLPAALEEAIDGIHAEAAVHEVEVDP